MARNDILARLALIFSADNAKLGQQLGESIRQLKGFENGFKAIGRTLTAAFSATAIFAGLKQGVSIIADFEHTMQEVKAITGATGDEFKSLEKDALRLGAATKFTADEVGQLQVAFGRLGFNTKEILDATEATLALAAATGEDLAKSADVAGSTVRGFGLRAKETQRVVDVMASSFNKTALGLDNFTESMKYVAPIAAAANVSVEETTALLGVLADAGIRGSSAGTALRKIFGDLSKDGRPLSERLEELGAKGIGLKDAFDEVGRTAQTALLVLTKNTDKTRELTTAFQNASGEAAAMARIMQDDLIGDVDKLTSSFEGLILKLKNTDFARGFIQNITGIFNALAGNVDTETFLDRLVVSIKEESEPAIESFIEKLAELRSEQGKPFDIQIVQFLADKYELTEQETRKLADAIEDVNKSLGFQETVIKNFKNSDLAKEYGETTTAVDKYIESLNEFILTQTNVAQGLKQANIDLPSAVFRDRQAEVEQQIKSALRQIDILKSFRDGLVDNDKKIVESQAAVVKSLQYYRDVLKGLNEEFDKTDANDKARLRILAAQIAGIEGVIKNLERLKSIGEIDIVIKVPDVSQLLDPLSKVTKKEGGIEFDVDVSAIDAMNERFEEGLAKLARTSEKGVAEVKKPFEGLNMSGLVENAFGGIGEAIGLAITGTESLGKSLLRIFGGILSQFGKMLITAGVGILALKKAFQSLNPYVAIAAGIALVALGTAVGASTRSLGSSIGGGGGSSGSGSSEAGQRVPSPTSLSERIQFNVTGKLTADGRSLQVVLNNENFAAERGG